MCGRWQYLFALSSFRRPRQGNVGGVLDSENQHLSLRRTDCELGSQLRPSRAWERIGHSTGAAKKMRDVESR
jgi:hypothetical protein